MPIISSGPGSPFAIHAPEVIPRKTLLLRVTVTVLLSFLICGTLIFVPAGALRYWEGEAWMIAVFAPVLLVSGIFLVRNPVVLQRRFFAREQVKAHRSLVGWFRPLFLIAAVLPGLDYRFQWSDVDVETVPRWLALSADTLIVAAICFAGWVMHVQANSVRSNGAQRQGKVITAGPYSVVRHPLYMAALVLWLITPVALGSWVALPVFFLAVPFCGFLIRDEEKVLRRQLPGYADYCKRTPFRLMPFVW